MSQWNDLRRGMLSLCLSLFTIRVSFPSTVTGAVAATPFLSLKLFLSHLCFFQLALFEHQSWV